MSVSAPPHFGHLLLNEVSLLTKTLCLLLGNTTSTQERRESEVCIEELPIFFCCDSHCFSCRVIGLAKC
jgi:hypothetical protein